MTICQAMIVCLVLFVSVAHVLAVVICSSTIVFMTRSHLMNDSACLTIKKRLLSLK
jgi:hypothetical protein